MTMDPARPVAADDERTLAALLEAAARALVADDLPRAAMFGFAAIERFPEAWEALGFLSNLFLRVQHYPLAEAALRSALERRPGALPLRYNLMLLLLRQRRLAEAWPLRDGRVAWERAKGVAPPTTGDLPTWLPGAPAAGVLIWSSSLSMTPLLLGLVAEMPVAAGPIVLAVPARLTALAARSLPAVTVTAFVPDLAAVAAAHGVGRHLPLEELAPLLRPDVAAFPARVRAAVADPDATARLARRYRRSGAPTIGIAWATSNQAAGYKALALARLAAAIPAPATLVNLQYGRVADEVAALPPAERARVVLDPAIDPLGDLDPYAAQIAACDAVVTVAGLAAHLAGALAVPTIVLVPIGLVTAWYWHDGDGPSLWHPSVHMLHQRRRGDWDACLAAIPAALDRLLGRSPAP
ncbi:MAG: hypothetical protein IT561_10540 [Alphaproteobacteria bacterium]|nr:hypothetical protein [Alphaproteobacteria bacterium]